MNIRREETSIIFTFENQDELDAFLNLEKDISQLVSMKYNAYIQDLELSLTHHNSDIAQKVFEYFKNTYQ